MKTSWVETLKRFSCFSAFLSDYDSRALKNITFSAMHMFFEYMTRTVRSADKRNNGRAMLRGETLVCAAGQSA